MIITRYLSTKILYSPLAVSVVLTLVVMSGRLARYISAAADGKLAVSLVLPIAFYHMPQLLELILPLSFLLAIMLSLGELYETNEMAVMSATGTSPEKILGICLGSSVFIAFVVALFSFYISPKGNDYVDNLVNTQGLKNELSTIAPNRFYTFDEQKITVYSGLIDSERKGLENVFMFRDEALSSLSSADLAAENSSELHTIIFAEQGFQEYSDEGEVYFVLQNGVQFEGIPGKNKFTVTEFEKYRQKMDVSTDELETIAVNQEASLITDLLGQSDPESVAELHWRLSLPVVVVLMAALGMPLSRSNPRQGRYYLLIPALVLFLLYIVLLNSGKEAIAEMEKGPFSAIWSIHLSMLVLTILLFYWPYVRTVSSRWLRSGGSVNLPKERRL